MKKITSPPSFPEPWIVWDVAKPTNFCTITARTWFTACHEGRLRLGCDKVDARLESSKPLELIHSIDTCIICQMSPCICSKSTPPPAIADKPTIRECHQTLYTSFISTPDLKMKAAYRDKILALIFKKLFDL